MTSLIFLILIVIGISIASIKLYVDSSKILYIILFVFLLFILGICIFSHLKSCQKIIYFQEISKKIDFMSKK